MEETRLSNRLDCKDIDSEKINFEVKNFIFNNFKNIYLRNVFGKPGLLEGLKGNVKIEIVGDVSDHFANEIYGPKIIVNGNVGENSASRIINGKLTIFGSSLKNFASEVRKGEFYVLGNCGEKSFFRLQKSCNVVIGGQPGSDFARLLSGGVVIILNLKDGNMFIDEWFKGYTSGTIYLRGKRENIITRDDRFSILQVNEDDEDIFLPLISEFARQFSFSLSEIKSVPFCRLGVRG